MYKWYLPTLSEILALNGQLQADLCPEPQKAERDWSGAVAAVNLLLQQVVADRSSPDRCETRRSDGSRGATGSEINQSQADRVEAKGSEAVASDQPIQGIVLSGPLPILTATQLSDRFAIWTFNAIAPGMVSLQLPGAKKAAVARTALPTLPLLSEDPLADEPFCLVLTAEFSLVMAIGGRAEKNPHFLFSFEPEVIWQAWRSLQARLMLLAPSALGSLNGLVEKFPPVTPDYRTVSQFSRWMLANLPVVEVSSKTVRPMGHLVQRVASSLTSALVKPAYAAALPPLAPAAWQASGQRSSTASMGDAVSKAKGRSPSSDGATANSSSGTDTELLQAIAHEVRTPLTTIRTLTRLLLKRKDLPAEVLKRLDLIDRECTEQIDRFSLFFRAVELETTDSATMTGLAPIALDRVIEQTVPRWQQQATQHGHTLEVVLPQRLPMVITDPVTLNQALTGLIDRITHSLPPGSHIQVRVTLAGHQLKLQFESKPQSDEADKPKFPFTPALKSLGQLLMFQPETGNLSLNMTATKNLFQAIGGKLIVRQQPHRGEVLTIFLPLETR